MKSVDTIARIRREFFVRGKSIKQIVREVLPLPKLGRFQAALDRLLTENEVKPSRDRLTLIRLFEALQRQGYDGGYDSVRRPKKSMGHGAGSGNALLDVIGVPRDNSPPDCCLILVTTADLRAGRGLPVRLEP